MTTLPVRTEPYSVLVVGSGAREHALVVGAGAIAIGQRDLGGAGESWDRDDRGNGRSPDHGRRRQSPIGPRRMTSVWSSSVRRLRWRWGWPICSLVRGIPVFGPSRAAAELEWSKAFAKDFMRRHGIPTAPYGVFTEVEAALDFIRTAGAPLVVKADGLAAGKGVLICATPAEAEDAVRSVLVDRAFQAAGDRVVIEEFLEGEELSVIAVVDGERFAVMPPARDYKRLRDGDQGPNTGGMGSYAPVHDLDPDVLARVRKACWSRRSPGCAPRGGPIAARSMPG